MGVTFFKSPALLSPGGAVFVESEARLRSTTYATLIVTAVLLPLSWVTILLRVYTRARILKSIGWDDWCMVASGVAFAVFAGLIIRGTVQILEYIGPMAAGETPPLSFHIKLNVIPFCWYVITMTMLKVSLGAFLVKNFKSKAYIRYTVTMVSVFLILIGLAELIFSATFPCDSTPFFFGDVKECGNIPHQTAWSRFLLAFTILNLVTDVLYAGLTFLVIWQIQLAWRKKMVAISLCMLGTLGGVASAIRLALLLNFVPGYSVFGQTCLQESWAVIEPAMGITAGCMATLRPLLVEFNRWRGASVTGSRGMSHSGPHTASARNSRRTKTVAMAVPTSVMEPEMVLLQEDQKGVLVQFDVQQEW